MKPIVRNLAISIAMALLVPLRAQVTNVDFASQVMNVFSSAGCSSGGCHGSGQAGLTITTVASTTYNNIVGVPSSCGPNYIEPGLINSSYIYQKITGSQSCGGGRMPQNNPGYFDANTDQLEIITVWIDEGALETPSTIAVRSPAGTVPSIFALGPNYPNPFNPVTTLTYDLPAPAYVELQVHDLSGRHIRTLAQGRQSAGRHRATWRGLDNAGRQVPTGVYLYRVTARDLGSGERFSQTRKMVLLK